MKACGSLGNFFVVFLQPEGCILTELGTYGQYDKSVMFLSRFFFYIDKGFMHEILNVSSHLIILNSTFNIFQHSI